MLPSSPTRHNHSALTVIFITVFIDLVGFGMIIPLTPYLGKEYGADAFAVGWLMAIYSGFQFLCSPLWGRLSDRLGRRPILLMSLLGSAGAHLLFGLSTSLVGLFVARGLAGLFTANISTAMAYIADVTPEKDRSKGMGLIGAAFGLGFVVGPALGGILAGYSPNAVAYFASLICFVNFIAALFLLKESLKNKVVRERASRLRTFMEHFRHPVLSRLLSVSFLASFGLASIEAVLFYLVADRFQWDLRAASFGFAYVGISMALTQGLIVRKVLPLWGERAVLLVGCVFFLLSMVLAAFSYHIAVLAVGMTCLALGMGFINPSVNGSVSLLTARDKQGEVMGVVQSLAALARVIGPPAGGFLYAQLSSETPFLFSALCGTLAFIIVSTAYAHLPASARERGGKESENFDVNAIGLFQLQNIVTSGVPYLLFDVRKESSVPEAVASLLHKRIYLESKNVLLELQKREIEKQFPILLLADRDQEARALATSLEEAGYVNVYYIAGGVDALIAEATP